MFISIYICRMQGGGRTMADMRSTPASSSFCDWAIEFEQRVTKAPMSASETSAAEPIANPLPIAAVVLPGVPAIF